MISKQQLSMLLLMLTMGVGSHELMAQKRAESPLQIQLNFAGAFVNTFGEALSDPEVESFETEGWILPGIDIGYYLNKRFYIGYAFTPSRTHILKEPWSLSPFERDANIEVRYQSGNYHNLNLRYFPFKNGFYLGTSIVSVTKSDYHLTAERINSDLKIGTGSYTSDAKANWNFKSSTGLGFSLGYIHIFKNQLSLGLGLVVPAISAPYYENIEVSLEGATQSISSEDLTSAIQKIRNETFFYPIQINLHLGYNLKLY